MKKRTILLIILLSPFVFTLNAQDWVKLMLDRNTNVHDVQEAFYKWYGSDESSKTIPEHESGYELFKRWENIMVPRTYPSGNRNNMNTLLSDYLEYKKNTSHQPLSNIPTANWTYGGTVGVPTHGGDGRINHVRFFPGNPSILFACAPGGGLWKSTNGGASWATNTDQLTTIATSDVAIDPKNSSTMYLIMGDGDDYDAFTTGVLKSTDSGKTWNATGMSYTLQNSGSNSYEGNQLLLNPDSTNVIFAAFNFGLYRSRDYGATWKSVLPGNDVRDIEFEPFHSNVVYASTQYGAFYRSTNGGLSFTQITNGLPNTDVARIEIGVSPADSNRVYLLIDENNSSRFYGLYMSTDRGQTFTTQSSFAGKAPNLLGWSPTGNDTTGQAWYDLSLAVSPTNADTILVGGVNIWMSGDKGVHWTLNGEWTGNGAPYVHADIHHIIFYPGSGSNYVVGCDGGVFETFNKGQTWNDISNNLEIGELYTIGLSGLTPGLNISGWQDNGTNLSGIPWMQTAGGDGETAFIDYSDDDNMFASYENGSLINSTNGGVNWHNAVGNINEAGAWTTPWLQDPYRPDKAFVFAGYENVWYAKAPDFFWTRLSNWGIRGKYINCIAISPVNDNYIYVSRGDTIYATTNGGATWSVINNSLPVHSYSSTSVTTDPQNPLRVWVTLSGFGAKNKVYQSDNGGKTWTNISTGLPNLPVNCIVCQPNSPEGIYVGTDIGVYYHDTVLNTWVDYSNGLPNVMVNDLKISPDNGTLVAATYGRGVWQTNTYIATGVNTFATTKINANVYPNPTNGNVTLTMHENVPGDYTINIVTLLGQPIFSEKVNINTNYIHTFNLSNYGKGIYFLQIEGNSTETIKKIVVL